MLVETNIPIHAARSARDVAHSPELTSASTLDSFPPHKQRLKQVKEVFNILSAQLHTQVNGIGRQNAWGWSTLESGSHPSLKHKPAAVP